MDRLEQHLHEVVNKTWNFAGQCQSHRDEILNAVLGLAGEAGEVADQYKKVYFHGPKGDVRDKIIKELGDVCFYLIKLIDLNGTTLEEVLAVNKAKLESRHPELGKVTERFGAQAIR